MSEKSNFRYISTSHVRDKLLDAQSRRGELEYAQTLALQHAEWFASHNRMGYKTTDQGFNSIMSFCLDNEKIAKYPELASKIAEILPLDTDSLRAILGTRRLALAGEEMESIIDHIKKEIGYA